MSHLNQRLSLITLGVDDLPRAAAFLIALGWERANDDGEGIAAFDLDGMALALFPWPDVAAEVGMTPAEFGKPASFLAHNVTRKEDVAPLLARAEKAGATIVKPAQDVFWGGHSGVFRDPDGHFWEIAFNPFAPLGPKGEFQWSGVK